MPELPEVEVVRSGLDRWVAGRTITDVEVLDPRALRRHIPGAADFSARLAERIPTVASRRGKFLWLPLDGRTEALTIHLGMSGQALVEPVDQEDPRHLRVRVRFADAGSQMRFVDQRTFGGMALEPLVPDGRGGLVPTSVAHIARDPLDPDFDDVAFARRLRTKHTGLKRALLDQGLISGIGNIYADEALWRSELHYALPTPRMTPTRTRELLLHVREVMSEALAAGGTSFDSLYVNVNGQSGYFERALAVYGREDRPCLRCGRLIVREHFMNRSSFRCPVCQRVPARAHW